MPKNRLLKRSEAYKELENNLKESRQKGVQVIVEALEKLNREIEEKSKLSAEEFDEKKKKELLTAYKDTMGLIIQIRDNDKSRKIRKTMSKDINTLSRSIEENKTEDLNSIFENSRSRLVQLDKNLDSLDSVAGNQSTRFKLEIDTDDEKKKSGYFTENSPAINPAEKNFEMDALKKISEKYGLDYDTLLNDGFYENAKIISQSSNNIREVFDELPQINKYIANGMRASKKMISDRLNQAGNNYLATSIEGIEDAPTFRAFLEYTYEITRPKIAKSINEGLGISPTANINKRNAAMSRVAELIGCQNLLAHSESMHVSVPAGDGTKIIKGTFMEEAKGSDLRKLNEKDLMYKADFTFIDDSKGLNRKIADLQILDYLCGNPDRHRANIIYTIKDGKLVDIKGIDNDTCFGSKDHTGKMAAVSLDNLKVISKDTAKKIMSLDEETFKYMLYGYEIEKPEIENALNRLKSLKNKIIEDEKDYDHAVEGKLIPGKLKVCDDEELDYLSTSCQLGIKINEKGNIETDLKSLFGIVTENFSPSSGFDAVQNNYIVDLNNSFAQIVKEDGNSLDYDLELFRKLEFDNSDFKKMIESGKQLNKLLQSDLSCYHKQVIKGNNDGKEDSINIVMPEKLKTVKTLAEQSNRFCENFKKQVETLKDSEGKKHLLGFCESYLTHTKSINDNVDRIETKIGDINRIIKDKKQIAKDTEEVSKNVVLNFYQNQKKKIERDQLRHNANFILEPLEEKQAELSYDISEIDKKLGTEKNNANIDPANENNPADKGVEKDPAKRKLLAEQKKQMILERTLTRLELQAASGIRDMLTDPMHSKEDFERSMAAGIIRYKLELMNKKKPDSKTKSELKELSDVEIDVENIEKSIDDLTKKEKFKTFAANLNEASFKPQDIEKIAKGKFKDCFQRIAQPFVKPAPAASKNNQL